MCTNGIFGFWSKRHLCESSGWGRWRRGGSFPHHPKIKTNRKRDILFLVRCGNYCILLEFKSLRLSYMYSNHIITMKSARFLFLNWFPCSLLMIMSFVLVYSFANRLIHTTNRKQQPNNCSTMEFPSRILISILFPFKYGLFNYCIYFCFHLVLCASVFFLLILVVWIHWTELMLLSVSCVFTSFLFGLIPISSARLLRVSYTFPLFLLVNSVVLILIWFLWCISGIQVGVGSTQCMHM